MVTSDIKESRVKEIAESVVSEYVQNKILTILKPHFENIGLKIENVQSSLEYQIKSLEGKIKNTSLEHANFVTKTEFEQVRRLVDREEAGRNNMRWAVMTEVMKGVVIAGITGGSVFLALR